MYSNNEKKDENKEKEIDESKRVNEKDNDNMKQEENLSKNINDDELPKKAPEQQTLILEQFEEKEISEEKQGEKQITRSTMDKDKKPLAAMVESEDKRKYTAKKPLEEKQDGNFNVSIMERERLLKNFKVLNKDLYLKILAKVLYNKKNYFCELECKIFDDSYYKYYKKEEISDIDVFCIKFEEDLTCIKAGFECKSTVREGVDEILKLKGTQEYVGLNYAGLLKKRVANNVRLVANKLKIELYDEDEIKSKVGSLVPDFENKVQKETDLYSLRMSIENEIKSKSKGIISYMKSDYWTNEPYQNINTLVRGIEHVSNIKELYVYQKRYLLIKISLLLSISFLEIVSYIVRSNYSQAGQVALDQLFGGAVLRREKERTFDLISQEIGKKMHPYPYYTESYLSIIHWFMQELEGASLVPLCIEEIQKCFLMGIDMKNVRDKYSDFTIKLSKDIIRFTSKISKEKGILNYIYEI
ncbi:hypothetical protein ABH946_002220 [Bacillus sp. RC145]|uniref:hypothetical protein n=1 Tax=Bacillus TaxID=1386 RepID=UPI000BFE782B|nr:hypothetical protein [Bacillus cereus]PGN49630.1 hypothetical protein CN962_07820 [Bacillus cereus]